MSGGAHKKPLRTGAGTRTRCCHCGKLNFLWVILWGRSVCKRCYHERITS